MSSPGDRNVLAGASHGTRRKLADLGVNAACLAALVAFACAVGWEASTSLGRAQARASELRRDGQHLLLIDSAPDGCDAMHSLRDGPVAWGAIGPSTSATQSSGVAVGSVELTQGAVAALDPARTTLADAVLVGRALRDELGTTLMPLLSAAESRDAHAWDPPPPAEFAGRSIVRVRAVLPVAERCVVRFAGAASPLQVEGVAALVAADGRSATWTWQLPPVIEDEAPLRGWYDRTTRPLPLVAGAIVGFFLAVLVARVDRVDDASLLLVGVSRVALVVAFALRAALLGAIATLLAVSASALLPVRTSAAFADAALVCGVTASAVWIVAATARVAWLRPWEVLRYEG